MRSIGCRECRAVKGALVAGAICEPRVLPVRTVAFALPQKLKVAAESLEACRAQRRRHLALQRGFRCIVGTARSLRHCQRDSEAEISAATATTTAGQHGSGNGD